MAIILITISFSMLLFLIEFAGNFSEHAYSYGDNVRGVFYMIVSWLAFIALIALVVYLVYIIFI